MQIAARYGKAATPKSSTPSKTPLIKLLVTQQNNPTKPSAAAKPASSPKSPPKKQPKVAPMQKVGTISPPLKPAAKVMAVKAIFKIKITGGSTMKQRWITSVELDGFSNYLQNEEKSEATVEKY